MIAQSRMDVNRTCGPTITLLLQLVRYPTDLLCVHSQSSSQTVTLHFTAADIVKISNFDSSAMFLVKESHRVETSRSRWVATQALLLRIQEARSWMVHEVSLSISGAINSLMNRRPQLRTG